MQFDQRCVIESGILTDGIASLIGGMRCIVLISCLQCRVRAAVMVLGEQAVKREGSDKSLCLVDTEILLPV